MEEGGARALRCERVCSEADKEGVRQCSGGKGRKKGVSANIN